MSDAFQVAPCTPSRHCATRGAVTHYTPPPPTDAELRRQRREDRDRAMNGRYIRVRKDGRDSWVGPMLREEAEAYLRQHSRPARLVKGGNILRPTWEDADAIAERMDRERAIQRERERARREAREQADRVAQERREQAERERQERAEQERLERQRRQATPARTPAQEPAQPEPARAPQRIEPSATPKRATRPAAVPTQRPEPARRSEPARAPTREPQRVAPPPARVEPRAVPTYEPLRIVLPSVRLPSVRWAGAPVMGAAGALILLAPLAAVAALIGVVALSLPTIVFALPFVAIAVVGIAAALTERAQRPRWVRAASVPVAPTPQVAPTMPRMAMPRAVAPAAPVVRMPRPAPRVIGAPAPVAIPAPVAVPAPEPQPAESLADEFARHAMRERAHR